MPAAMFVYKDASWEIYGKQRIFTFHKVRHKDLPQQSNMIRPKWGFKTTNIGYKFVDRFVPELWESHFNILLV